MDQLALKTYQIEAEEKKEEEVAMEDKKVDEEMEDEEKEMTHTPDHKEDEEMEEEEEKEELSKAMLAAITQVIEDRLSAFKSEFEAQLAAKDTELSEVKAKLSKTAAGKVGRAKRSEFKQPSQKNLATLTPKERIAHLSEIYSNR